MKKYLACLALAGLMTSCTWVTTSTNPEFRFPATSPNNVVFYDRLTPSWPFIILARMTIDATWTLDGNAGDRKIRREAARIGGDAIIITDVYVDILAFNRGMTTTGRVTAYGNDLYLFQAVTRPNMTYVPIKIVYGYVIKRSQDEAKEKALSPAADIRESSGWSALALSYAIRGEVDVAVKTWQKSIELNPMLNVAWGHYLMGFNFEKQDNLPDAITAYEEAAKIAPKDAFLNYNLAVAYFKSEQYAKAKELFLRLSFYVTAPETQDAISRYLKVISEKAGK